MKLIIIFFSLFLFLVACDKPDPEPEKADPIYNDLQRELGETNSAISSTEKELEGFQKDLEAVVPQTGQVKYAGKRVSETSAKLEKLRQMKKYWEIRIESRKSWVRQDYLAARKDRKPWPRPEEYEQYKMQRKLEQAPRNWNAKQRMEDARAGVIFDTGSAAKKEGHGEEAAEPKPEHH